ncbi:MAG: hypothetical protein QOD41_2945 [Cryptosporangiaceae bacterium]|nr:hypothetical protein [Cryptosporangiaceae bacterium]
MGRRRRDRPGRRGRRAHRRGPDLPAVTAGRGRGRDPRGRGRRVLRRPGACRRAGLRRRRHRHGHPVPAHERQPGRGRGETALPRQVPHGHGRHHPRRRGAAPGPAHAVHRQTRTLRPDRRTGAGRAQRQRVPAADRRDLGLDAARRARDPARPGPVLGPAPAGGEHPDAAAGGHGRGAAGSRRDVSRPGGGADRRPALLRRADRPDHGRGPQHPHPDRYLRGLPRSAGTRAGATRPPLPHFGEGVRAVRGSSRWPGRRPRTWSAGRSGRRCAPVRTTTWSSAGFRSHRAGDPGRSRRR